MTASWRPLLAGVLAGLPLLCGAADGCHYTKLAELPVTLSGPSRQPTIDGTLDGMPNPMVIDTGASQTILARAVAERHGYTLQPTGRVSHGIGGSAMIYAIKAKEFGIGPSVAKNVAVAVQGNTSSLDYYGGLVGADVLLRQDMELALADGKLRFFRDENCRDTGLSYWSPEALETPMDQYGSPSPRVTVMLNGKAVVALVDTGASKSVVFRDVAEKMGVRLDGADVRKAGRAQGIGDEKVAVWEAPFDFKLAEEEIKNARLQVVERSSEGRLADFGMLLGRDWLRAHRVLFAVSQGKMYFSYLGTPVFD